MRKFLYNPSETGQIHLHPLHPSTQQKTVHRAHTRLTHTAHYHTLPLATQSGYLHFALVPSEPRAKRENHRRHLGHIHQHSIEASQTELMRHQARVRRVDHRPQRSRTTGVPPHARNLITTVLPTY